MEFAESFAIIGISRKDLMKTLLNTLLGTALALCAASTASANTLLVFITPGQILSLAGSGIYGANCNSGMTNCGVYAIGFVGASGGTAAQTVSITNGAASISPDNTGTDKWVNYNILPSSGAGACDTAAGCSAFEVGGTASGNTQEKFITNNANTVGRNYTSNVGDTLLTGVAPMNATTDSRGIGFLLTFATNVAAGTTTNVTFELLASKLSISTGAQGTKGMAAQGTISGLTLVALPEPSSWSMLGGGIFAVGFAAWRRRKQS